MAYAIVTIPKILDEQAFQKYASALRGILKNYEGRWVAIEEQPVLKAGAWPYIKTVMIEFPTLDHAQRWYESPEYREIIPVRERAFHPNIVLVRSLSEKDAGSR